MGSYQNISRLTCEMMRLTIASSSAVRLVAVSRNPTVLQATQLRTVTSLAPLQAAQSMRCSGYPMHSPHMGLMNKQSSAFAASSPLLLNSRFHQIRNYRIYQRRCNVNENKAPKSASDPQKEAENTGKDTAAESSVKSEEVKTSFWQHVKQKAKQYGKIFVVIHLSTYVMWFGGFYYLSVQGVDVSWLLEKMKVSESTKQRIENSKFSHAAIAFVLVKLIMPLRDVVSIALTEIAARALRARGYLPAVTEDDKLRNLVRKEVNTRVAQARDLRASRLQMRTRRDAPLGGVGHGLPNTATSVGGKRTLRSIAARWRPERLARLLKRAPK